MPKLSRESHNIVEAHITEAERQIKQAIKILRDNGLTARAMDLEESLVYISEGRDN